MALRLAVDFDANDWCCLYGLATDPNNTFTLGAGVEAAASIAAYARAVSHGSVASTSFARYTDERAKYGKTYLTWTLTSTVGVNGYIGYDFAAAQNSRNFAAGETLTAVCWVARAAGGTTDTWKLEIWNNTAGTVVASSAAFGITSTTTWLKLAVTGTAAGVLSQYSFRLQRQTGTNTTAVYITGAMLVGGAIVPGYYNSGTTSLLEPITSYWMDGRWDLGFVRPYQYVAPVGKADLTLKNADKRFSPEYASSPLFGKLKPNLLVQIGDPDYGIWWTGWSDSLKTEPGTTRNKRATLAATDARRLLGRRLPVLPLYAGTAWRSIVSAILAYFTVPNSGAAVPINGTAVSGDAWTGISADAVTTEYYADNIPFDHEPVKVFGDLFGAQQAKMFCGRDGVYELRMGTGTTSPGVYVAIDALWMDAGYEAGIIINNVEVMGRKRILQNTGPYTVWTLDETFAIAGLGTESFRIYFTHSNESKTLVGAGGSFVITETNSGVAGDITAALSDIGAQSAIITYTNTNAAARNVLTTTVTATERVSQLREYSKETEDATSIAANGILSERLDFNFVQTRGFAKSLANYRVNRFKDVRWEIPWVSLHADKHPSEAFAARVGAAVRVTDAQTDHSKFSAVIGEQHTVKSGLKDHRVRLYLESIYGTSVEAS